ncbi:hypothetical protein IH824_01680 [candidate division KSB1 bacterium]|nr:hypothetical protein [candidate division KSB1 bacterium]
MSAVAEVDTGKFFSGELDDKEWQKIANSCRAVRDLPLYFDDTSALTPLELRSKSIQVQNINGLGLIVVDFLIPPQQTPFPGIFV